MSIGEIISLITLLAGAVLGLSAMFSPAWASRVVRLVEDPDPLRPGGYSEFRATYGGLFLFSHLMTAILLLNLGNTEPEILTVQLPQSRNLLFVFCLFFFRISQKHIV